MIRHTSSRREDRVADAVGCVRAFGSVFVGTGTVALVLAVTGASGLAEAGWWPRIFAAVIGAAHLGGGLAIWGGRWAGATVRRSGIEWAERRPFRPAQRRSIAPSEVEIVEVEEDRDSEGDDVYRVVLRLASGERLPLTHQYIPSREAAEAMAAAVARRIQKPEALA